MAHGSIFVFPGVIESGPGIIMSELQSQLEATLSKNVQPVEFNLKEHLLTITLSNPDFRFHIIITQKEKRLFKDWVQLAKDFELPWDKKPVDKARLRKTFVQPEKKGWLEYN